MDYPETFSTLGHYCGRFGPGFWGEPANSFSNLAFVFGGLVAILVWRQSNRPAPIVLVLILLASIIGVGSFIFHSWPSEATLAVDLIPIQVFGLCFMSYVLRCRLKLAWPATVAAVLAFFLISQLLIRIAQPGLLGGGFSHVPTLLVLGLLTWQLRLKLDPVWRYLALAIASYVAALTVRTFDIPLCHEFPIGLHWLWHLLTALAVSLIILGTARHQDVT